MNFFFRTNFSDKVGLGHLFRCLRLIKYFKNQKHTCYLFVDSLHKKFDFLKNLNVIAIYKKKKYFFDQKQDSLQFIEATKNYQKGVVIIDDYRIGEDWERRISKFHDKIVVIDDLNKKHYSDYIINYNPSYDLTDNFNHKNVLKKNCKLLLGHKFSILENRKKKQVSKNFNVIMYNGSSGDLIFFKKIINFFLLAKKKFHKNIVFKIVIGPYSKNKESILNLSKKNKQIIPIINCHNLNDILSSADLFVGSAGVSSFETAHNKIPSILFQANKNQKVNHEYMENIGHFVIVNLKDLHNYKKILQLILLFKFNYTRFKNLSKNQKFIIDSKGTKRILSAITKKNMIEKFKDENNKKTTEEYYIRKINDKDINHYLYSRNLKFNRNHSSTLKKVALIDHYYWWFTTKRISYVLIKNNERILYLYHEHFFKNKMYNYFLSGWFACSKNCTIKEIVYAQNWQKNLNIKLRNDKKKIKWLCIIKDNNKFIIKFSKYIGWKKLSENNSHSKILKKYYNINKGYVCYSR